MKNKKANKNNTKIKEKDKVFNILKIICFTGMGIVLVELLIFGFMVLTRNRDINVDLAQKIVSTDKGYIISGSSNFYDSDYVEELDREVGKVAIYEKDKVISEFKYDKYYRSVFYDVKKVAGGYIAVGATEKDVSQHEKGLKDALIVKFNDKGKVLWSNAYHELDNSYFRSLLIDNDKVIVVGSSTYASDVIGNEKKGGAIIVKYDLDGNSITNNHFGGNKLGAFNDLVKVGDFYYAVGNDTSDNALIVKMDKDFKQISVVNYKGTNRVGFTSIVNANNSLYAVCSKAKNGKEKSLEQAVIVQFDYDLKVKNETVFKKDDYSIWNDIIDYNGNLYVVGDGAKKEGKKKSLIVKYFYKGIFAKYDYKLNLIVNKEFEYDNNDFYKSLIMKDNCIYVVGFTNSKIKDLGSNKYNYVSIINKYDFKGNLLK